MIAAAFTTVALPSPAQAQDAPAGQGGTTLPPLPGEAPAQPAPGQAEPAPARPSAPPAGYEAPPPVYYQQQPMAPKPPELEYTPPPEPKHAPKYALYAGASLRYIGFGGYFFQNQLGQGETTGNFIGNGPAVELNVGARLGRRYIPFVLFEHGFTAQGHRFAGSNASSVSDLYGIGFRTVSGDPNEVGFLGEISVGVRSVTVNQNNESYKMSALEFFRLGLGAEIRLATLFTLSPMAHISSGVMNDTNGNVTYSPQGSGDGLRSPRFANGANIQDQRAYVIVGIGCGGHFDIFGK